MGEAVMCVFQSRGSGNKEMIKIDRAMTKRSFQIMS